MTEQRCTYRGRLGEIADLGDTEPCNIPIEGYGPCAWIDEFRLPCSMPENEIHHYEEIVGPDGGHRYQPSQWRHRAGLPGEWAERFNHEATP